MKFAVQLILLVISFWPNVQTRETQCVNISLKNLSIPKNPRVEGLEPHTWYKIVEWKQDMEGPLIMSFAREYRWYNVWGTIGWEPVMQGSADLCSLPTGSEADSWVKLSRELLGFESCPIEKGDGKNYDWEDYFGDVCREMVFSSYVDPDKYYRITLNVTDTDDNILLEGLVWIAGNNPL